MTQQTKTCIAIGDGDFFDFLAPQDHNYDIKLIAHALSNICRYNGHSKRFYSVAEHSVLVSMCVPADLRLCALLHDASEAYVGDVTSPLKKLLPDYVVIEDRIQECIANEYNLPWPFPADIHIADKRVYKAELSQITNSKDALWYPELQPADVTVRGLSPTRAKKLFLDRYEELLSVQRDEQLRRQKAA